MNEIELFDDFDPACGEEWLHPGRFEEESFEERPLPTACDHCLRHAWLLSRIAPHLEHHRARHSTRSHRV